MKIDGIGAYVRAERKERRLTQLEVAELVQFDAIGTAEN